MSLFGKKKQEQLQDAGPIGEMAPPESMPSNTPTEAVSQMQQQGLSNNQIIQELQRQGYNSQQIFDAMNQAQPGNVPAGPVEGPSLQPEMSFPAQTEDSIQPQMPNMEVSGDSRDKIEEMAEAIIDEKWEELVKSINKIIEWKEKMEGTINKIEQELKDSKDTYNQLHSAIVGKINEYDQNIVNVGTQVKAMEKVFEKVLPTFTENITELKRIVKNSKK